MLSTLEILLPVFGLIFAGFVCRRRGLLGPTAASELNRFVVWLALPALLFDIMAHSCISQRLSPPSRSLAPGYSC
jgi:malonate transporter